LKIYENLPPSAVLPVPVAAAVKGVSDKTIRRNYELIPVSDGRVGVRKGDLEATRKLKHEGIPRSACEGMTEAA
jgi:hypothetical protein